MKKLFFLMVVALWVATSFGQMLYNNGTTLYVNDKVNTSTASLRVNGDVTNNDGSFTNSVGLIEVTGNWTNIISANNYNSTGIERFIGTANQLISGTWNGTSGNNNQLYDFKINKTTGYVSIAQNTHVNPAGSINFESTGGIIRTATASSSNTGDYAYYIYVQNPATTALSGYSWPSGTTKYIEGKLKRQVNSASTYQFPIGFQPSDKDGMEPFQVTFNSAPASTGLLGYIRPAANLLINSDLITNGTILFYDIGGYIDPNNNFSQCTSGPDGRDDVAAIDQAIVSEWMVLPDAGSSFNYNITVYPGSLLDNITYATMGAPCNGTYTQAKYLARDGRIGGNGAVGPTTNYWIPGVTGLYQAPTGNTLINQNGFSRFRLFGATDNNTSLPVELLSFTLSPIDNKYFAIQWVTASELNNDYFSLERSVDGITFTSIATIPGNGTSSATHDYYFNDYDVVANKRYYYRLKQVDTDGTFTYSSIITGVLSGTTSVNLFPNPTTDVVHSSVPFEKAEVYTIIGQWVKTETAGTVIHMNDLARAEYIIKIYTADQVNHFKIIKK